MKIILIAAFFLTAGCANDNKQPAMNQEPMEHALIIGSKESPDPVLVRVRELEKSGAVKDVVVLESFPVQIRLYAPRKVIDDLNNIPRVGELR